jgi:Protein of unknown function (DUF2281)
MVLSDLHIKIESLPVNLQQEVVDFVDFLKSKSERKKSKLKTRQFGFAKGKIFLSKDFDAPLEMFNDYKP